MAMFGFGIFVCVASVLVIILSLWFNAKDTELPWGVTPIIIWATVEVNLAIVSGTFIRSSSVKTCAIPEKETGVHNPRN
jgi:hypothetical protein